jgi:sporulation protein YlmC with PRC-barrel domain
MLFFDGTLPVVMRSIAGDVDGGSGHSLSLIHARTRTTLAPAGRRLLRSNNKRSQAIDLANLLQTQLNKNVCRTFDFHAADKRMLKEDTMFKRHIAATSLAFALLTATAIAQTSAPSPSAPSPGAPTSTNAPAKEAVKVPDNNLAGQGKWRATKLIGVDIYGPDNKKVGDVTEVLFDKTGKIEMVTVGVGGFLGMGSKDVAIPFEQVSWSDQPMAAAAPAPAPSGSGSASGGTAATAPAASAPRAPAMYPDHGKITMTKDQLTSAPAVTYSGS